MSAARRRRVVRRRHRWAGGGVRGRPASRLDSFARGGCGGGARGSGSRGRGRHTPPVCKAGGGQEACDGEGESASAWGVRVESPRGRPSSVGRWTATPEGWARRPSRGVSGVSPATAAPLVPLHRVGRRVATCPRCAARPAGVTGGAPERGRGRWVGRLNVRTTPLAEAVPHFSTDLVSVRWQARVEGFGSAPLFRLKGGRLTRLQPFCRLTDEKDAELTVMVGTRLGTHVFFFNVELCLWERACPCPSDPARLYGIDSCLPDAGVSAGTAGRQSRVRPASGLARIPSDRLAGVGGVGGCQRPPNEEKRRATAEVGRCIENTRREQGKRREEAAGRGGQMLLAGKVVGGARGQTNQPASALCASSTSYEHSRRQSTARGRSTIRGSSASEHPWRRRLRAHRSLGQRRPSDRT